MPDAPEFQDYLANDAHDWMSQPFSMHGWRLSGKRRVHGCAPARIYHAGLDYLTFYATYLEPLLAFEINGAKPKLVRQRWTPAELSAVYQAGGASLTLRATMPDTDGLLVEAELTNTSGRKASIELTAYGEGDRDRDPDAEAGSKEVNKTIFRSRTRRLSDRNILTEAIGEIADSHRGGLLNFSQWRILDWHHAVTGGAVVVRLPAGGESNDAKDHTWRQTWTLALPAGKSQTLCFAAAAAYQPRQRIDAAGIDDLAARAIGCAEMSYAEAVGENAEMWQGLLEEVAPPPAELKDLYKQMYYRAWTCIWQLVTPGFDTGRLDGLTFQDACLMVTKADHRAVMPAEWETVLGAHLIAQQDPELATKILDAVMASVEDDGFVPENLVFTKALQLPFMTSYVMWEIYQRTGDKEWMRRHWAAQRRSILAHYRNPSFVRHDPGSCRNIAYVHIGYIYMVKIAEELQLSHTEVAYMRWMVEETRQILQNFWDPKRNHFADAVERRTEKGPGDFTPTTSIGCMAALFAGATDEQKKHMLNDLRNTYLVGEYGLAEGGVHSGTDQAGEGKRKLDLHKTHSYKFSNWIYFLPGLAAADPDLCRIVAYRTVRGIAEKCGDFWEQILCDMTGIAFGPMSVFGAYGYITSVQMLSRLGLPKNTRPAAKKAKKAKKASGVKKKVKKAKKASRRR